MKKLVTMFTAILTILVMSGISIQAKESQTVWIDTQNVTLVDGTLQVPVSSDGTVTDGMITLNYDSDVLTMKEDTAVKVGESVGMYAVNILENEVRISFVSEKAIEKGDFMILTFSTENTDTEEAVDGLEKLTGTGYTTEGSFTDTSVGILTEEVETPDTDSKEDQNQTEDPKTGDSVNVVLPMIFLAVGAACVMAGYAVKEKGGDYHEI